MTIVNEILHELTQGKSAVDQRIAIFERVRNIPYRLIPALYDPLEGMRGILLANAGSCTPKHFLLGRWFELLDYETRYVTYVFDWNNPDLQFPHDLRALAEGYPDEYHLALQAHIEKRWTLVDATWDPFLRRLGFQVNMQWDGRSDTINAVAPISSIEHDSPQARDEFVRVRRSARSKEEKYLVNRFILCFNRWLDDCRYEHGQAI